MPKKQSPLKTTRFGAGGGATMWHLVKAHLGFAIPEPIPSRCGKRKFSPLTLMTAAAPTDYSGRCERDRRDFQLRAAAVECFFSSDFANYPTNLTFNGSRTNLTLS
jgi:hypothetical protein